MEKWFAFGAFLTLLAIIAIVAVNQWKKYVEKNTYPKIFRATSERGRDFVTIWDARRLEEKRSYSTYRKIID